jgi:hypothetical protein
VAGIRYGPHRYIRLAALDFTPISLTIATIPKSVALFLSKSVIPFFRMSPETPTDTKGNILLVDDDPFLLELYATKFSRDGYTVKSGTSVPPRSPYCAWVSFLEQLSST